MTLSSKTGAVAAIMGVLAGAATLVSALAQPETAACLTKVLGAFGEHGAVIGSAIVGVIATVAPLVTYVSHPPKAKDG